MFSYNGAHIGIVTLPVAMNMKEQNIYSFEPSKKNLFFSKIPSNKKTKYKNVKVIEKIVSSKTMKNVKFFENSEATGMNSIIKIHEKQLPK